MLRLLQPRKLLIPIHPPRTDASTANAELFADFQFRKRKSHILFGHYGGAFSLFYST
jgi:hypothetical protein